MSLKRLGPKSSHSILAQLEESLVFDEYVNNVCLGQYDQSSTCFISGANHSSYSNVIPVEVEKKGDELSIYIDYYKHGINVGQTSHWSGNEMVGLFC